MKPSVLHLIRGFQQAGYPSVATAIEREIDIVDRENARLRAALERLATAVVEAGISDPLPVRRATNAGLDLLMLLESSDIDSGSPMA